MHYTVYSIQYTVYSTQYTLYGEAWTCQDWCAAQILEPREETVGRSVIKHTNAEHLMANSRLLFEEKQVEINQK